MENPEDAKKIHQAVVYKKDKAAAVLTRHPGTGVVFSYLPAYLSAGGRPIASTLPVLDVPVAMGQGSVPAYFAGLLPEGERLAKLRWAVKTTISDEFSLLLAAGANPVGDVQILPTGVSPAPLAPQLAVRKHMDEVRFADFAAVPGPVDQSALAGMQDKITASYVHDKDKSKAYILKFNDGSHKRQVETEHLLLHKAKKLGIAVSPARIVYDGVRQSALLVGRFDRSPAGPLGVEDGAQLLGLSPSRKASIPAEAVASAVVAMCSAQLLAARNVFLQFLFAWLTGNGNLHAKNISVVQQPSGEWFVAPAYDLQCTLAAEVEQGFAAGVPGGILTDLTDGDPSRDPGLLLPIGGSAGSRTGLVRNDWMRFARTLKLPERLAQRCIDVALAASRLSAAELPFDAEVSSAVVRVLGIRRDMIQP